LAEYNADIADNANNADSETLARNRTRTHTLFMKIDWLQDECPIKATVDVIGGRWKPLILYYLLDQPKRFSALRREIPGVTSQMLALQLRQLEEDQIVARKVYAEVPVRVEYELTKYGRTLSTLLLNMRKWGEQHLERRNKAA
jgi:DNA-binding HxlR family transcriptional regulator